jgi:hypothetical protein
MPHRRLIDPERFVNWTKKLIRKHNAHSFGNTKYKEYISKESAKGKNWEHPRVRKTLFYLLERNTFSNSFSTRKEFKNFLLESFEVIESAQKEGMKNGNGKLHVENKIDDHVRSYLIGLMRKNKVSKAARKEFVNNVILSTELFADQVEATIKSARKIDSSKGNYETNAADALGHLSTETALIFSEVDTIINSMKRFRNIFG